MGMSNIVSDSKFYEKYLWRSFVLGTQAMNSVLLAHTRDLG